MLEFRCSDRELLVPVHVQRWIVLQLHREHGRYINYRTAVRLYQRQCYPGYLQLVRLVTN